MFCKNCGNKSEVDKKFCTNCGNPFSAQTFEKENIQDQPIISHVSIWQKINTSKIVIVLVVLGIIGYNIYSSRDETAVDKNNSAQTAYESGGDPNLAISQLQQASQDAVTNSTKMATKVNLAYVYSSEGKEDLALSTFKEALVLASVGSVDYYLISGEIALLEGKPNAALVAYNKAYEKDPNDFQVNNALNLFYLDLADERPQYSNYPKALTYALKANEVQTSDITKQNLAIAYHLNENYKQAISVLSSVTNVAGQPYVAYWLGLSYAGDEQPVNAKRYLQIAINGGVEVPQEVLDYMENN